ncbi:MAG: AMP-binding protein, partial [Gammaproteobacteria bacterium]|nr:AMP-binding protein [Gammaproteobacteria bacterium]
MDRIWIQHYPEGVPVEIDPDAHGSLTELLDERIRTFAEHDAFTSFGTRISYAALDGQARSLTGYLQSGLKLARGERIALMLPNLLQYPVAVCAALRAGLVVVNVNPLYTPRELKHQLNDSQTQTIVILADVLPVLMEIAGETGVRNIIVTEADDLLDSRGSVAAA